MAPRLLLALLMLMLAPALAQAQAAAPTGETAKGPALGEFLKTPKYKNAWQIMMSGEGAPFWVYEFARTFDGPPTPVIPVELDGETYTLGFTCKPNDCENNQLYVLFAPEGRDAWALLATPDTGVSWLGRPNQRIQDAITGALRK